MEVAVRALHAAAGEQAEKCRGETKKVLFVWPLSSINAL